MDCIFCEIIKGNIPSSKVYEDDDYLAILDISQTTEGHTLVIPKKHYNNVLEMPNEEFSKLMSRVQQLAIMIKDRLKASGMNILINTGEASGQTVMHAHVHLIPRYNDEDGIKIEFSKNDLDLNKILSKLEF